MDIEQLANVINRARYPDDRIPRDLIEEDVSSQEYARRIARAVHRYYAEQLKRREPCIAVGYTSTPGDGNHIRQAGMFTFRWLPNGYGSSLDDRLVCAIFDPEFKLESSLRRGERHPLIEAVASAIENHLRDNPIDVVGFLTVE